MRAYLATYRLRNGSRGTLTVIDRTTCGVVQQVLELFGVDLRAVSVRPA